LLEQSHFATRQWRPARPVAVPGLNAGAEKAEKGDSKREKAHPCRMSKFRAAAVRNSRRIVWVIQSGVPHQSSPAMPSWRTRLIHSDARAPEGFASLVPPVFRASTTLFPNARAVKDDWREAGGYTYGLCGRPPTREVAAGTARADGAS